MLCTFSFPSLKTSENASHSHSIPLFTSPMNVASAIDQGLERGISMTPPKQNQVSGRYNDTELHLAAYRGDLASVKHILDEIKSQMVGTLSGADFDAEVAKMRASVVNEVNNLGQTAVYIAAKEGHLEVVKELLKYSDKATLKRKGRLGYDPLHIADSQGHDAIVKLLLDHDVSLSQTRSPGNASPLITAASNGHTAVVLELLSKDPSLLDITSCNGKNALHLAARSGHVETVKSLLEKYPQLATRTDRMGQTALHIATTRKKPEIVNELLCLPDMNINALTRNNKTALDIVDGLSISKKSRDIQACLLRHGAVAVRSNKLNQSLCELRNKVIQVKNDFHKFAKEVRRVRREVSTITIFLTVAVLLATITFAAVSMVPGLHNNDRMVIVVNWTFYKVFSVLNGIAVYMSLAGLVIHMTWGVGSETEAERRKVDGFINKLLWLASVCTLVAFMALSYTVVGQKHEWVAVLNMVFGGAVMVMVLGALAFYVVKSKRTKTMRREKVAKSGKNSSMSSIMII